MTVRTAPCFWFKKETQGIEAGDEMQANQLLERAIDAHMRGALEDAKRLYEGVLELDPRNEAACGNLAIVAVQSGALEEAERLFCQAIADRPHHAEAHYNLGAFLQRQDRLEEAMATLRRAVKLKPDYAAAWFNLGNALKQSRRLDEALAAYRQALRVQPKFPQVNNNIGVILQDLARPEEAVTSYRQAISLNPNYAEAHHNLALLLQNQGRLREALEVYQRVIQLAPSLAETYINVGAALRETGRLDEAIAAFERALALRPNYAQAHYNVGVVLQAQGHFEAARGKYQEAIALKRDYGEAYNNIGVTLQEEGSVDRALGCFDEAIKHAPTYAQAYNNFGLALLAKNRPEEAFAALRQALSLSPAYFEARYNLGNALRDQGLLEDAILAHQAALKLKPNDASALAQLYYLRARACDWTSAKADESGLLEIVRSGSGLIPPFVLLGTEATASDQLRCSQRWSASIRAPAVFKHAHPALNRKIKIGYLSGDFYRHATAFLTAELFERHDRARFDVVAYSYGLDDGSQIRTRIVESFDRFVDVRSMAHKEAATLIHGDCVDILIDLKGHTHGARPQILACRPAPIQVNYLGFPGTLGADYIDYIIADRYVAPVDQQAVFADNLVILPDAYQPNDTKRLIPEAPSRGDLGLPDDAFVFCCFNNSFKITPTMFDIWMRLLKDVSRSVLWLLESNAQMRANLQREAVARGINAERLIFAPILPQSDHLARQGRADLFLDTLPCNAHTTTSDALWAGLPVLTCMGDTFAGRVAGSLLRAIDLPEMVTNSLQAYEALALRLARSPSELSSLRCRLAANRLRSPLFDAPRYARNLEAAFERMMQIRLAGESPRSFVIRARDSV
jgi:protein O-GlcNAc transferase